MALLALPPDMLADGLALPRPPVAGLDPLLPDIEELGGGLPAVAPWRRSSALMRSLTLARSSRSRLSSLLASLLALPVPPDSVLAPETELLPGLAADVPALGVLPATVLDDAVPGWPPEVLDTLGVSAEEGALVVAAGADAGGLLAADDGGVLSALDAEGTLGSPGLALGGVAAVVDGLVSEGAVVTGAAGVSTLVSLVHAAIDVPIATAPTVMRNLRVNMLWPRVGGCEHPRAVRGV